jgi:ferredoxin/coenzyme F420-reducing hydrogenase delta subunit
MADISMLIETLGKLESLHITVHPERCVVVRNRNASCRRCAKACTSTAIHIEGNELNITPDLCTGCGTCATVCPTAALEAQQPNDAELIRSAYKIAQEQQEAPIFACGQLLSGLKGSYDRSRVIEVGCLGRLDESQLVSLIALGIPAIILSHGECATCPNSIGENTYHLVSKTLETLLNSWGHSNSVSIRQGLPPEVELSAKEAKATEVVDGMSRRDFFTQIKTGAQNAAVSAASPALDSVLPAEKSAEPAERVVKVMKDGTLPHFIPNRRERLLDHLDQIGQPVVEVIDSRLWGHVEIDTELCNSCRMCATFCPTGAIYKFDDRDGSFGVEHYPADCVQCRLCQDICPTSALSLQSEVPVKELVEGVLERHEMRPVTKVGNKPDSIYKAMYDLLGGGQIYER